MEATKKYLSLQYRKNGNPYVDYLIEDEEGYLKSIPPMKWTKLKLEDATTKYNEIKCYTLLVENLFEKLGFGVKVDIHSQCKKEGLIMWDNPKDTFLKILNR